jgi:hypothetical protein
MALGLLGPFRLAPSTASPLQPPQPLRPLNPFAPSTPSPLQPLRPFNPLSPSPRAGDEGFGAMMLARIQEPTLNREVEFLAVV